VLVFGCAYWQTIPAASAYVIIGRGAEL
jgi:hypothetical protein